MPNVTIPIGKIAAHNIALTANVVTTVTIEDRNIATVDVISDGAASVFYTMDGSTPTVNGSNCYVLPAGAMGIDNRRTGNFAGAGTVSLISTGSATISVQRGD